MCDENISTHSRIRHNELIVNKNRTLHLDKALIAETK
jgi:hypothetical protein